MPRYCDACRTFITSRDSLTRNAHPIPHAPRTGVPAPRFLLGSNDLAGRGLAHVMSPEMAERQALLVGSCPKNIGNLRQLAWYFRQVSPYIETLDAGHHY